MVYTYHTQTKHSPQRYARSLGYMDWATQPDPYRTYLGTKKIALPLSFENVTPPYQSIFDQKQTPIAPFCKESISQFFQFSLGLAAIKSYEGQSWALRCNASSGNLQPTEAYLIANDIQGIQDGVYHYGVKEHNLELLSHANETLNLSKDSFLVGLSSIVWREAWKYGERSWRYTQLDCGHAFKALEISAKILGWKIDLVKTSTDALDSLLGLDDPNRAILGESEHSDMLLVISKEVSTKPIDIYSLRTKFEQHYHGQPNVLSAAQHDWDILPKIEKAVSQKMSGTPLFFSHPNSLRTVNFASKDIVLKRRSAQVMNKNDSHITKKEFETLLQSVVPKEKSAVNLVLFIHNVEDIEEGLYISVGDTNTKSEIQNSLHQKFLWERVECGIENFYLLEKGNFQYHAKMISCNQDIAAHGAFSLGMLVEFDAQIKKYGAHRYKELYWNCGAIGQQLYLEATSLHLSATGIGCYLDDVFHALLGIQNTKYQSLYHFTIGRGLIDTRLTNEQPYQSES